MTRFRTIIRITLTVLMISIFSIPAFAARDVSWSDDTMPAACDNTNFTQLSRTSLTPVDDGFMRVFFDGQKIGIEYFDCNMNMTRKGSLELELPIWGGFYAGADGYYIAEGQNNTAEDDSAEVIRIIRYDKNWKRTGAASITPNTSLFGGEVRYPFDYGSGNMAEYNRKLYFVTGHEGYVDEAVGQGHQGMLLIEVDETSMTGEIVDSDLWHSFAQYIKTGTDGLYILEQSEGSRCTNLSKYIPETRSTPAWFSVLDYGGIRDSEWAIPCYASVDGLELSRTHALSVGTSIDQSNYDNVTSDTPYNIYLTATPFDSFSKEGTSVRWLTSYTGGGKGFIGLHITKVNDNRFMISWEEEPDKALSLADPKDTLSFGKLRYMFVDGAGEPKSQVYSADAPVTDCVPVVTDGKIVYYASSGNMFNIYTIDPESGAFSKKAMRVAGPGSTWDIKDGVLTISGFGPIEIAPTDSPYSSFNDMDVWKLVNESVTKIDITSGITSISDNAFEGLYNVEEVDIADGLLSIGKEAFTTCEALGAIFIPDSVTSIGEDFIMTVHDDTGPVTWATVYANCTSYAAEYARNHSIKYISAHDVEDSFTIDLEPTCTEGGSKSRHCKLCGDKTEVTEIPPNGHDYELGEIINGNAEAACKICGDQRTINVPVGVSVYWRKVGSQSPYYYGYPADIKVGETMSVIIEPEFAGDDEQLGEFIVDTGVEQIRSDGYLTFSYSKPGAYPVKVYSRYRPEICRTYTIKVADESGYVPGDGDTDEQHGSNQTPANPDGAGQTPGASDLDDQTSGDQQGGNNQTPTNTGSDPTAAEPGINDQTSGDQQDGSQTPANLGSDDKTPVADDSGSSETLGSDPDGMLGTDGTALGEGASAEAAEAAITGMTSDKDLPGSVFSKLQLRSKKQTKTTITLSWKKATGAKKYIIYGNKCGKKTKPKMLAAVKAKDAKTYTKKFTKVLGKKLRKGTYYKFMIVALDKDNKVVSSSKIIHVATKGGKVGNVGKVTTKAKRNKVTIRKGKKFKLAGKQVAASKKLKVKKHRAVTYESTNPKVATVTKKGVIKGKKKGSCYVYAYAQNGVSAKVKVTIR